MNYTLNIKCSWKHAVLEYLIKMNDRSHDLSRAAVFEREVKAAENVKDWTKIRILLSSLKQNDDAPIFTNLQAKYDEATAESLTNIRNQMLNDLNEVGLKVLQNQYMVLLLQMNYLETLKRDRFALQSDNTIETSEINLPEISKILTEMMLTDKDCDEMEQIKQILMHWKSKTSPTLVEPE